MTNNDPNISALLEEMSRLRVRNADVQRLQEAGPLRRVLGMYIGDELYGIGIENITEIVKMPPVTFVPGAPPHVLGVTSLRGQIVPLVNMRLILNVADPGDAANRGGSGASAVPVKPRVVVIHQNDILVGLLVDSVTEVYDIHVPLEAPFAPPTRGYQIKEGWVQLEDQTLILLHIPTLLTQLVES